MNATGALTERPSTVGDLMALEPVVVMSTASLTDAARLMDEFDISGLPVHKKSAAEVTVEDLLTYFPMRYEDRSRPALIRDLHDGVEASYEAEAR